MMLRKPQSIDETIDSFTASLERIERSLEILTSLSSKSKPTQPPEQLRYNTRQAARLLGISQKTLTNLRIRGGGPLFQVIGDNPRYAAYYYTQQALADWVNSYPQYHNHEELRASKRAQGLAA